MVVDVANVLVTIGVLFVFLFILFCLVLIITSTREAQLIRYEGETIYCDPCNDNIKLPFPSLAENASLYLSVIIPAYEEEARLPKMLDECLGYLENRRIENSAFTYEIIVVDDGSKDRTSKIGLRYSQHYGLDKVRVMTLCKNRGKGGAVKLGVYGSRGKYLLFADADGATKFSDFSKLENAMKSLVSNPEDDFGIVIGSRAHLEKESIAQRSIFRTVLMYGFHFLVWFFCVKGIRDTQCGFKTFTRAAAQHCFSNLHIERWAFDVELLYVAQKLKMPIEEVAVTWTEIDGSKVIPFWSWLQMGKDLSLLWLRYQVGAWKIKPKLKLE